MASRKDDNDNPNVNAQSKAETVAAGQDTHGILNQHPADAGAAATSTSESASAELTQTFRVGVAMDRNKRWRRTMEDAHAFVYGFGGLHGQGFFGVFDGHAGKHAAEWCGKNFHEYLLSALSSHADQAVPDIYNIVFHSVDETLSEHSSKHGGSSGCTAVTAFLRLEHSDGTPAAGKDTGGVVRQSGRKTRVETEENTAQTSSEHAAGPKAPSSPKGHASSSSGSGGGIFSSLARRMRQASTSQFKDTETSALEKEGSTEEGSKYPLIDLSKDGKKYRRVLYTANVGDARAVLCRGGKACRLTYDHKGSDAQEAKRITDAGGFVMNHRVNGVLAVTRSLGDTAMKEFVVGSPYTTETTLSDEDTFLIVACDGLWDVIDDQDAVDLIRAETNAQTAAEKLLQHALSNFSTDNTTVMVIRFRKPNGGEQLPSGLADEKFVSNLPEQSASKDVNSSEDKKELAENQGTPPKVTSPLETSEQGHSE